GISVRRVALVEPVRSAEIPRIGLSARTGRALLLLKTFQFLERSQQGPRLQPAAVIGIRDQPQDAVAASNRGFELEYRLDRIGAGARHPARRRAIGIDLEIRRLGAWH